MIVVTLKQVKQMVEDAIIANKITDVEKFYVDFSAWNFKEETTINICLYCKSNKNNSKNISAEHENPAEAIRLLIEKHKQYDIIINKVELAL